ncbi:hypothetical protein CN354_15165 [Bacillus cereus]|nr:hypothetical protein CN354_15165 [Bacillus cereus]
MFFKKITTLAVTAAILSTVIIPFSDVKAAENEVKKQEIQSNLQGITPQLPSKAPVIKLTNTGNLAIQDGSQEIIVREDDYNRYNWKYLDTQEGNNVSYNKFDQYMQGALVAGLGGSIAGFLVSGWAKGVAGYISGQIGLSIPKNKNVWYTVQKFYDYDSVNVYIKYRVWVYSNSSKSRSSLIKFYEEIHKK